MAVVHLVQPMDLDAFIDNELSTIREDAVRRVIDQSEPSRGYIRKHALANAHLKALQPELYEADPALANRVATVLRNRRPSALRKAD